MAKSVVINLDVDSKKALKNVGDLTDEMELTVNTLGDMREAVKLLEEELEGTDVNTKRYKELRKELINVNTEIKNQELAMEALDNEQVASELKSVAGGLTDMAGGFALVGVAGESMEKVVQTMAQVEGATKIVTGAIEGYSSLMKLSSTITKTFGAVTSALANSQVVLAVKTKIVSAVTAVWNAILAVNPIVLIVTAVGALIAGIIALIMNIKKVIKWFKDMAKYALLLLGPIGAVILAMGLLGDSHTEASDKSKLASAVIIANLEAQIAKSRELQKQLEEQRKSAVKGYQDQIDLLKAMGKDYTDVQTEMLNKDLEIRKEQAKLKGEETNARLEVFNREKGARFESIDDAIAEYKTKLKLANGFSKHRIKANLMYLETIKANTLKANEEVRIANNKVLADQTAKQKEANDKYKKILEDRKKAEEEYLQRSTDAWKAYDELQVDMMEDTREKEIAQLDLRFDDKVAKLDENNEAEKALIQAYADEKRQLEANINNKWDIKEKKEALEALKAKLEAQLKMNELNTELLNANNRLNEQQYNEDLKTFEENLNSKYSSLEEFTEKRKELINKRAEDEKALEDKKFSDELNRINAQLKLGEISEVEALKKKEILYAQHQANLNDIQKEAEDERNRNSEEAIQAWGEKIISKWDEVNNYMQEIGGVLTGIMQSVSDVMAFIEEENAVQREERFAKETEALKAQLANREISQKEYDNKLALMEKKKANEELQAKRKAFNSNKAIQITEAIMSTAQGVLNGFMAGMSFGPAAVVMAPLLAAMAGAFGAVQIGLISAQKFRANKGGRVPGAPSDIDSVDAKLAKGEMVINAQSSEMFGGLLSEINQAGGGIPLVPDSPTQQQPRQEVFGQQQPIVKAIVVETELNEVSERNRRIERRSSI